MHSYVREYVYEGMCLKNEISLFRTTNITNEILTRTEN